jgi:hypothetical protein
MRSRIASGLAGVSIGLLALLAGCAQGRSRGGDGGSGPCSDGAHRCAANVWEVCRGGAWVEQATCPSDQACTAALGCTPCAPAQGACSGDQILQCGDDGQPTATLLKDCSPSTCVMSGGEAQCAGPCDPAALAKSYTGCVYYAVDLPQWAVPGPGIVTIAADQQFAIAVANPWTVAIDVVVERDDAMVGSPAQVSPVAQAQVAAGGLEVLPLPQREVSGYVKGQSRNRSLLSASAYRITTSRPASVYQFNPQNNPNAYSNDASLLIPVNALDESYVVLGWPGAGGDVSGFGITIQTDKRSFVTIVGTRAGTKVRVTPSTTVMASENVSLMQPGRSYTFTLNEFESLNLEGADFAAVGATDFSGTRIEANAPLAVWSGVECITINPMKPPDQGTCCCDHLEEQLFPRSSLGTDYVVVRSEGRSHSAPDPEFFRVMALDDMTDVQPSLAPPDDHFTLAAGSLREMMAMEDFTVRASHPVMVGQFQVSQDSSPAETGDPSFELVPPIAQFRTEYIFLVPSGYAEDWLLAAVPSGVDLALDGNAVPGCDHAPAGMVAAVAYDALRCPLGEGPHTVSATMPFGMVLEGWGPGPVSYGYTAGMEFHPVNDDCTTDADCQSAEFCSGGACVPIIP